ncbi:hypothetical protein T261_2427 [Streptomyces lydicus]|nr:hypothetical protein T261_2427 [Streptomyces lydicus]
MVPVVVLVSAWLRHDGHGPSLRRVAPVAHGTRRGGGRRPAQRGGRALVGWPPVSGAGRGPPG